MDWYTPLRGRGEGAPYGHWSFLADGATPDDGEIDNWFELLDCWFDDTSEDPGGFNGYVW
jgi:clostripain